MASFAVGRFQPPTIGHALMIQEVMKSRGDAFIFVSSATTPKSSNPLTAAQKIAALEKMFPRGVTFVDTSECDPKCGGPVQANNYLRERGYTDITLLAGSDRAESFGPDAPMWKSGKEHDVPPPKFKALTRTEGTGAAAMSGTKARKLARDGDYEGFANTVRVGSIDDAAIRKLYTAIRKTKDGRTKKNKASSKALYPRGSRLHSVSSKTSRSSYGFRDYSKDSSTL
jgi:nicotinic acid mononucleotide adenylyltransferase